MAGPNPAKGVAGGEVGVGGNDEQANADLWAPLAREEVAGGGRSTASGDSGGSEHGDGVVPVGFGRGKAVEKLHGLTVELTRGSARADRVCSGGSAAASSSPGFGVERRRRSGVWGGGESKRVRGKACGASCNAHACVSWGPGALSWPGHGGVEVAAGGRSLGAWRGRERANATPRSGGGASA
jgi:hypothetical protein